MGQSLFGPTDFRDIVSGRRRTWSATLLRCGLSLLEVPYSAAMRLRNWRYDVGMAGVQTAAVPVVGVGNLTLGGTGKTPAVEWLARWFAARQVRVGLVSRGYGAKAGQENDEAQELADKLPGVPHVLDANRARGANRIAGDFGCQLVILDDAFQHRRLARDVNIALVDATEPFGFGHVFPRGTLREPLLGWRRADCILLTRSELVTQARRDEIRAVVRRYAPRAAWAEATYPPSYLISSRDERLPLEALAGQSVAAFCGIGNPSGFRAVIDAAGYQLAAWREFADHFAYTPAVAAELAAWAKACGATAALCTAKDLVKLRSVWPSNSNLYALCGQLQIQRGEQELAALLEPLAAKAKASRAAGSA
jgi:tetraacyldisaccharide 4'-kinase